ncbi:adenylate/guanylate cyclase domain-containing protein [bacterium]|nr:adenylate/guanylate cyclase domain-containing protein [bacterium]
MSGTQEQTSFILFTDIYRSSALWERYPDEFSRALEEHNGIVEEAVQSRGGEIMKNLGDGYIALFDTASVCVSAMVDVERGMDTVPALPDETRLQVRLAGHGGPLKRLAVGKGYFGHALNRASRIVQVCHPGQALVSDTVRAHTGEDVDGARLTDLGSHHLRDLAEPEHLYQLDHPDFALHEFPPLPTLSYRPNNLVYQPNAFIGREREHAELKRLILEKKQRLITVTAPGGYGKSRLATQLCANLLDFFENGVFEVLLAPVGSHERIVSATADALGFQFYGKAEPQQQLIDYLREKQMLISFDNFEHVMEGKDLLSEILQHAPKVSLLVTSREPLRLKAEKVYRLEPLPTGVGRAHQPGKEAALVSAAYPGESEGREELPEAVQLFLDRATLVKHDFALTAENFALVSEICAKLDGVPLSLELAAAWADSFTLGELLTEVEHQLELTAKMSDVPERQRSIRASLDWSYNLLSDEQRNVIRAVSTFKGGFFFEAAMGVDTLLGCQGFGS